MTKNEETKTGEDLWNYTCNLYGEAEVEAACLSLQNNYSADVNVILFLCWLGSQEIFINNHKNLPSIVEVSRQWQKDIIEPLRHLRKQIGAMQGLDAKKVKSSLLRSELEAEKSEQLALLSLITPSQIDSAPTHSNAEKHKAVRQAIGIYFEIISDDASVRVDQACWVEIDVILEGAFR